MLVFLFLVGVVCIGFVINNVNRWKGRWEFEFGPTLAVVVVGLFITFFVSMFLTLAVSEIVADDTPVTYNLTSMNDAAGVEGHFFLGSGSVESVPVFFYYSQQHDGSYRLFSAPADNSRIVQYDGPPKMVRSCSDFSTTPDWLFWPVPDGEHTCDREDDTVFYVPEGSITTNFNLDAQ